MSRWSVGSSKISKLTAWYINLARRSLHAFTATQIRYFAGYRRKCRDTVSVRRLPSRYSVEEVAYETITTVPRYLCKNSSSHSIAVKSRWLVGSSKRSKSGSCNSTDANPTFVFLPPLKLFLKLVIPVENTVQLIFGRDTRNRHLRSQFIHLRFHLDKVDKGPLQHLMLKYSDQSSICVKWSTLTPLRQWTSPLSGCSTSERGEFWNVSIPDYRRIRELLQLTFFRKF